MERCVGKLLDYSGAEAQGVILVDLAWILHRGFHAIPTTAVVDGEEVKTGHYFSLVKLVVQAKKNYPFYAFVVCADSFPEKKHEEHSEYKSGRSKRFDLKETMINAAKMISCLPGVYTAIEKGKKADEVMYSLSRSLGLRSMIMSGDNDLLQSINSTVQVVRSLGDPPLIIGQEYVDKKFGVPLEKLLMYRVLRGDDSDNIGGVMGGRRAKKIIAQCSSMGEVREGLNDIEKELFDRNYSLMKLNVIDPIIWKSDPSEAFNVAVKYRMFTLVSMIKHAGY